MNIVDKETAQKLGITSMPRHISPGESGENIGVGCRTGAGGIFFWFDVIKLKEGEFRTKDRRDLFGKTSEEVRAL